MVPFDTSARADLSMLYIVLAACCIALALNLASNAVRPLGALARVAAAIAGAGMAAGAAFVLIVAALVR